MPTRGKTAEEKLKELYELCTPKKATPEMDAKGIAWFTQGCVQIDPKDIDLIANLVVGRIKGWFI